MAELDRRVDHALAVARASEAAALEIGAAALDAAEQAHRAAELAERASARVAAGLPAASAEVGEDAEADEGALGDLAPAEPDPDLRWRREFDERADRLLARLTRIGSAPS